MANIRITDLTAYTDAASTDVLPIVDISNNVTKKISISDLLKATPLGSAAAPAIAIDGDPNTGIYSPGADTLAFVEGGTEAMRIDSSGRVGIGTTGPTQLFHLAANNCNLYLQPVSNAEARIQAEGGTGGVGTAITFHNYNGAANGERARIDSSGRLLVGTSTTLGNPTGVEATFQIAGAVPATFTRYSSAGAGSPAVLGFQRSYSNSVGTHASLLSGSEIATLRFSGSDGTAFIDAASITAVVDGTPGTNDMPGRLVFSTTADGASSPTERMRIDNGGSTSLFSSNNIGLDVSSSRAAGTTDYVLRGRYGASANTGGTTSFQVFTNGNVQNTNNSYAAISDLKLKENIVDAGSQWDDLKALQVRNYNFKEGQTHTQIGLVAQEVELISPGLVTESPDRDEDGNDLGTVTKSVNYSVLYMKAVKALQEAMERIETLEAKVAALEAA